MRQRKRDPEKDLIGFLERLPVARVGVNNYTEVDRARDFIVTFKESDAGQRVLAQIAAMCDPFVSPNDPNLANKAIWAAAQRNVMAQIARAFVVREEKIDETPTD